MTQAPFDLKFDPPIGAAEGISEGLNRIVAPNASPMTFRGTNTYLLGATEVAVIDPGPENAVHLAAILEAVKNAGQIISHILVTHSHVDHSPLARELSAATGAPVYALGSSQAGRSSLMKSLSDLGSLGGGEGVDDHFEPDFCLEHGEEIAGQGWSITALATPGHFCNHMCFAWNEDKTVFTGDHIMSWATTMVSPPDGDLSVFMDSLKLMAGRKDDRRYFPGHGSPVENPADMIRYLTLHRKDREAQILDQLKSGPASIPTLTSAIYTEIPAALLPAASRNVFAHLIDLTQRNVVVPEDRLSSESMYELTAP